MRITRKGARFFNTWEEGNTVYTQDLQTGYRSKLTRKEAKKKLRGTKDMEAARKYANGEVK